MKKFSFELEKVLEFRDFERKQAENELAKALNVETEIQNNLQIIANQVIQLNSYMKGSKDFNDVISASKNKALLDYQKEELLKQLTQAKLVSEEKRKILSECMKKTTALEKMKEMEKDEYSEQQRRLNRKKIEELASIKSNKDNLK